MKTDQEHADTIQSACNSLNALMRSTERELGLEVVMEVVANTVHCELFRRITPKAES